MENKAQSIDEGNRKRKNDGKGRGKAENKLQKGNSKERKE
jgi:hypothetical protein